jgi:hypothetical protein
MRRSTFALVLLLLAAAGVAQPRAQSAAGNCGEVVTIETHERSTTRYALAAPEGASQGAIALVLLAGGSGHLDLDDKGCARALKGNSLVRSVPLFRADGFFTALVDAPSSHHGEDGLGGFRTHARHADDLGKVIADVRARTNTAVWLVGTSRGAISAANAASRLSGPSSPDGVVLTSAVMAGQRGARKPWVAHSVFDLELEAITVPVLVVGHAADTCIRSPANLMGDITARTKSAREQVVTVTGGSASSARGSSIDACEGRSPHGFIGQEAEVAAGIARFIRGGKY